MNMPDCGSRPVVHANGGIWARCLPFAVFMLVLALRSLFPDADPGAGAPAAAALDVRWLYAAQALVALIALGLYRGRYVELRRQQSSALGWAASLVVGTALFLLWIAPLPSWTTTGDVAAHFQPIDGSGALRWDLVIVRVLGAVAVVPLMEELFWRSFLLRWIDRRDFLTLAPQATSWMAIGLSSAVFALAHNLWLAALIAGMAYALLYRRFGNLWYPILAHATTNALLAGWVLRTRAWGYW